MNFLLILSFDVYSGLQSQDGLDGLEGQDWAWGPVVDHYCNRGRVFFSLIYIYDDIAIPTLSLFFLPVFFHVVILLWCSLKCSWKVFLRSRRPPPQYRVQELLLWWRQRYIWVNTTVKATSYCGRHLFFSALHSPVEWLQVELDNLSSRVVVNFWPQKTTPVVDAPLWFNNNEVC